MLYSSNMQYTAIITKQQTAPVLFSVDLKTGGYPEAGVWGVKGSSE